MPRPAVAVLVLTAAAVAVVAPSPKPAGAADQPTVDRLVAQLADPAYARRERAARALDALGPAALPALRAAARSANPETARHAALLAERIERREANAEALAPTLVTLTADEQPLAAVLADLSLQAGFPVVLGGPNAADLADDPVTLDTGRVPFWEAVVAVCRAADLHIRSVNDAPAPGTPPATGLERQTYPIPPGVVVLGERGTAPRRPAAVFGGVLVEAVPVPAAPPADAAVTLLLVWPEPKLNWQSANGVRVDRAADAGRELAAFPDAPPAPVLTGDRAIMVRQLGARRAVFDEVPPDPPPSAVPGFTPNNRQAVVRVRPGAHPTTRADLGGVVLGVVRTHPGPVVRLDGLKPGTAAEARHPAGVELRAVIARKDGAWELTADLILDPNDVIPAGGAAPAVRNGFRDTRSLGRSVLSGLRVADADGGEFALSVVQASRALRADGGRMSVRVVAALTPKADGLAGGDPSAVSFLASYSRTVEVPFSLAGAPLTGGQGN